LRKTNFSYLDKERLFTREYPPGIYRNFQITNAANRKKKAATGKRKELRKRDLRMVGGDNLNTS
jgi:hypothetical protein